MLPFSYLRTVTINTAGDSLGDLYLLFIDCVIYFRYRGTVIGNRYGPGTGDILLDGVQCLGNETSIADCLHTGWGVHNCNHSEDVSVSCGTSTVGLHYGNFHNINRFRL